MLATPPTASSRSLVQVKSPELSAFSMSGTSAGSFSTLCQLPSTWTYTRSAVLIITETSGLPPAPLPDASVISMRLGVACSFSIAAIAASQSSARAPPAPPSAAATTSTRQTNPIIPSATAQARLTIPPPQPARNAASPHPTPSRQLARRAPQAFTGGRPQRPDKDDEETP